MTNEPWKNTANRFVLFLDILGFKDIVFRSKHEEILNKLISLKNATKQLENLHKVDKFAKYNFAEEQTKSVSFSDSVLFFSKGDSDTDALKIVIDAMNILILTANQEIAIKGAISYGQITADFTNNLFFGQPIIDAYLLHEDLKMLTVVVDNNFEKKALSFQPETNEKLNRALTTYNTNLKSGIVSHKLVRPVETDKTQKLIENIQKQYFNVSGYPRIYIDNTLRFLNGENNSK